MLTKMLNKLFWIKDNYLQSYAVGYGAVPWVTGDIVPLVECGGDLNAPFGTISSPNYPNLYPHSRICRWRITVPQGRRVTLTINDLRLEDHGTCLFDFVEVRQCVCFRGAKVGSCKMAQWSLCTLF